MKRLLWIVMVSVVIPGVLRAEYLGSWKIDDYLPIPVATHRLTTGNAYAPTVLTYSIYEQGTAVGLDEDVDMVVASPFDTVVGFYLARRQLTAAAGFEAGKEYTVLIKATVDGVSQLKTHTFQIQACVTTTTNSDKTGYALSAAQTFDLTGNVSGSVGSVTAGVTLADSAITSAKFDGSTAFTQTGDAFARLGAPAGASVSADIAAVKGDTAAILTDTAAADTANELRTLLTGGTDAVSTLTAANVWQTNISAYAGAGQAGTYVKTLYDDWLDGGRLDLLLDGVKADTDAYDTDAEHAKAVWSALTASYAVPNSFGALVGALTAGDVSAVLGATVTGTGATVDSILYLLWGRER